LLFTCDCSLNSNGHQFHQVQESEKSPLNSNVHQFHQDQQSKQSPVNGNGNQFHQDQQNNLLIMVELITIAVYR
jgi:hypothetical protein